METPIAVYMRALREGHGLTQEAVAAKAAVHPSTYRRFERGASSLKVEALLRALIFLGGSAAHLCILVNENGDTQLARRLARDALPVVAQNICSTIA